MLPCPHIGTFVEDGCNSKHRQKKYVLRRSTTSKQRYPMWCHVTTVLLRSRSKTAEQEEPHQIGSLLSRAHSHLDSRLVSRLPVITQRRSQKMRSMTVIVKNKAMEALAQARERRGTSTSRSATGPSWLLRKLLLERHVKTDTMRVEFLTTTDVDFFTTLLDRHEEAQSRMNALTPQLFLPVSANVTAPKIAQAIVRCF